MVINGKDLKMCDCGLLTVLLKILLKGLMSTMPKVGYTYHVSEIRLKYRVGKTLAVHLTCAQYHHQKQYITEMSPTHTKKECIFLYEFVCESQNKVTDDSYGLLW